MKDIVIVVSITLSVLFIIISFVLGIKVRKLKNNVSKLFIENSVMQEYIDIVKSKEDDAVLDELVDKENFIKFLSDSRDWAFKYIEDVQRGLGNFVNEIEPEIAYFDEYGLVGDAYPHYHSMKKISQEYKQLKKLLPTEELQ